MKAPRVDVRRLLLILLLIVMLPLTGALMFDLALGSWPLLTIFGAVIVLPAGTFFLSRAALNEMNKVIAEVAPPDDESSTGDVPVEELSVDDDSVSKAVG